MSEPNTFEKLKKKLLDNKIIAFIALGFAIFVFFSNVFSGFIDVFDFLNQGSSIQISDVVISNSYRGLFNESLVDLSIQNTGNQLAILKNVQLEIEEVWELKNIPLRKSVAIASSTLSPTGDYEAQLPTLLQKASERRQIKVFQQIKADEADRFIIRLTQEDYLNCVYHVKGVITYGDNRESRFPRDLLILVLSRGSKLYVDSSEEELLNWFNTNDPDPNKDLFGEEVEKLNLRNSDLVRLGTMPIDLRVKEIEAIADLIPRKRDLVINLLKQSVDSYLYNKEVFPKIADTQEKFKATSGEFLSYLISLAK